MKHLTLENFAPTVSTRARTDIMRLLTCEVEEALPLVGGGALEPSDNRFIIGDRELFDECFALKIVMTDEGIGKILNLNNHLNLNTQVQKGDLYLTMYAETDICAWKVTLGDKRWSDFIYSEDLWHRKVRAIEGRKGAFIENIPINHTGLQTEHPLKDSDKYSWDVAGIEIDWNDVSFYLKSSIGRYKGNHS